MSFVFCAINIRLFIIKLYFEIVPFVASGANCRTKTAAPGSITRLSPTRTSRFLSPFRQIRRNFPFPSKSSLSEAIPTSKQAKTEKALTRRLRSRRLFGFLDLSLPPDHWENRHLQFTCQQRARLSSHSKGFIVGKLAYPDALADRGGGRGEKYHTSTDETGLLHTPVLTQDVLRRRTVRLQIPGSVCGAFPTEWDLPAAKTVSKRHCVLRRSFAV